jgi:hypothetical protein
LQRLGENNRKIIPPICKDWDKIRRNNFTPICKDCDKNNRKYFLQFAKIVIKIIENISSNLREIVIKIIENISSNLQRLGENNRKIIPPICKDWEKIRRNILLQFAKIGRK